MFTFLYYVTMFYFSIFCLTILDKINKGEIKTKADLKNYLLTKSIIVLSKYHKLRQISNNTYNRCIKYNREDDESNEENEKISLFIFTQDKKSHLKVKIENDKINLHSQYLWNRIQTISPNEILYIENNSFFKELKDFNCDGDRDKIEEDIFKFLNGQLLTNNKLFINIELILFNKCLILSSIFILTLKCSNNF